MDEMKKRDVGGEGAMEIDMDELIQKKAGPE